MKKPNKVSEFIFRYRLSFILWLCTVVLVLLNLLPFSSRTFIVGGFTIILFLQVMLFYPFFNFLEKFLKLDNQVEMYILFLVSTFFILLLLILLQKLFYVWKSKQKLAIKIGWTIGVCILLFALFPKEAGYKKLSSLNNPNVVQVSEKKCSCLGYSYDDPGSEPPGFYEHKCYGFPLSCEKEKVSIVNKSEFNFLNQQ